MAPGIPRLHLGTCAEAQRLLDEFWSAVQEVTLFHEQQVAALMEGDHDTGRFVILIHMASERRQAAKYPYLQHVEAHGCDKLAP